jgi:hypothetical protein
MVTIDEIIEIYLSTPPMFLILVIFSWAYIIPAILVLRSYRETGLKDYLNMGCMFLFLMMNLSVSPLAYIAAIPIAFLIANGTGYLTLFTWCYHSLRTKWKTPPFIFVFFGLIVLVLGFLETLFFFFNWNLYSFEGTLTNLAIFIDFLFMEIIRGTVGFFILFGYINPPKVIISKRVDTVIWILRILGLNGLITGILNISSLIMAYILQAPVAEWGLFYQLVDLGAVGSNYIFVVLVFYIAVRYAEFLLVSEAQVLRACRLYAKLQAVQETYRLEKWGLVQIKEYIESIPDSIFIEACPDMDET